MRSRIAGVLFRPRRTMAEVCERPTWVTPWILIMAAWAVCGTWLVSTPVGRQAMVDERVRLVEAFGGRMGDAEYARVQANPPLLTYFMTGGRLLLAPPLTLLAALSVWLVARARERPSRQVAHSEEASRTRQVAPEGQRTTYRQALAVTVHATMVLALGQIIATPIHYVRESLTSPLTVALFLPFVDEGTLLSRVYGVLDLFGLWWLGLMAIGTTTLTRRRRMAF
ncbi:MAG: YIP1 family protein [Vicinamibacterales bacterium]